MAEIKCPLCGTLNPEDAEECRHCHASLQPGEGGGASRPADDFDFGDLRQMGDVSGEDFGSSNFDPGVEAGQPEDEEQPEWLQRIRNLSQQEEALNEEEILGAEEEVPAWIKALAGDEEQPPREVPGAPPEEPEEEPETAHDEEKPAFFAGEDVPAETPDWLSELEQWPQILEQDSVEKPEMPGDEITEETDVPGESTPVIRPMSESELPEWLRSLSPPEDEAEEPPLEREDAEQERNLEADFLRSLGETSSSEPQEPVEPEEETGSSQPEVDHADDDLSDWLASFDGEAIDEARQAVNAVDALEGWDLQDGEETFEEDQPGLQEEVADTPAGIEGLRPFLSQQEDEGSAPEGETPEAESTEGIPDWMWTSEEETTDEPASETAIPDWLHPPGEQAGPAQPAEDEDEDTLFQPDTLPAWMLDDETESAAEVSPESAPSEREEAVEPLETSLEADEWSPLKDEIPAEKPSFAEDDDGEDLVPGSEETDIGDLSEWLGDISLDEPSSVFGIEDQAERDERPAADRTPPFFRDDLDTWIEPPRATSEPPAPAEKQEEEPAEIQEIEGSALPDWLDEKPAVKEDLRGETREEEAIQGAALPDWLAAMRPIESVLPEVEVVDDKKVEQAGPLAGLRGVLPVHEASTHYRKPPVYSLKLQVTEKQRAHAAMFENMLEEEQRVTPVRRGAQRAPQRLVRAVLGLLMIAVILLPLLGIPPAGVKVGQVADIAGLYETVEALPSGSSVLVAVDFAPGYSGEMRLAATGVIQRMMARGLRIAMVSTQPSGPVLAEGLVQQAFAGQEEMQAQYLEREWYINLGYLPGEVISLQELVNSPQQALKYGISAGLDNHLVWDSGVLRGIQSLDDFSAVLLLVDTVETSRGWIEQVQPGLGSTPFLIVSSAQAAPMLKPYVQSGQVQGLLSGVAGGISYEETILKPDGDRSATWLANQFGLGAAILILLIAALIDSISSLAGRSRPDPEV